MSGTTHQEESHWIRSWFPRLGQDDVDQFLLVEKEGERKQKMKTKYRVLLLQHKWIYLPKQLTIVIAKAELNNKYVSLQQSVKHMKEHINLNL